MSSRKEIVERELHIRVPDQYAVFLEKYGIYHAPGVEVYGMSDSLLDYDGIPCVIGATKNCRNEGLPHRFLVLEETGLEDEVICLNTIDGKVYSISRSFGNRKIADSFDEWFQKEVIEHSERPNKYAGAKLMPTDRD
ncbi:MAG: SMI1/KNR4 family protein [Desulfomonilaceae bacterium]